MLAENEAGRVYPPPFPESGREKTIKDIAEEILIKTTLTDEKDYAIYIKEDNSLVIKKMPEKYKAYIYIKDITSKYIPSDNSQEPQYEKIKDVYTKLMDIVPGVRVYEYAITYEAYVHDNFIDEMTEIVYRISAEKYALHDKSQAWAIAFQYEKRFKAKYTQYSKYAFAYVNVGRRYEPGIKVIIPQPSEKFISVLQKIFSNEKIETMKERIEREIREKEAQIERLRSEIEALKAEKERLNKISINVERVESVVKEVV
jgi:hypothetical protein